MNLIKTLWKNPIYRCYTMLINCGYATKNGMCIITGKELLQDPLCGEKHKKEMIEKEKQNNYKQGGLYMKPGKTAMEELNIIYSGTRISWTAQNRILDRYGSAQKALITIQTNPYGLIEEITGVGFTIADNIAGNLGIEGNHPDRIQAGILHTMNEKINSFGHTCIDEEYLIYEAGKTLEVDEQLIQKEIQALITKEKLVEVGGRLATKFYYMAEEQIAGKISAMLAHNTSMPPTDFHMTSLFKDQINAINKSFQSNIFILTGPPGTGKTFTIKTILEMYEGKYIAMCAPTGKAAKRMIEQTGKPAYTIHKLLEPFYSKQTGKFEFGRNSYNSLEQDIIIVDESSMLSTWLMYKLMSAIQPHTKLILVGDTYQLPPVGAGYILGDMLASGVVPSVELNIIKRQNPGLIITNCHNIKDGKDIVTDLPDGLPERDFFFFKRNSLFDIKEEILDLLDGKLKKKFPEIDIAKDVQVISPLNEKTLCSCKQLNEEIQKELNPSPEVEKCNFKIGDKVIQTKNDYRNGIINGDIGYVRDIDMSVKTVTVEFDPIEQEEFDMQTMQRKVMVKPRMIQLDVWKNELKLAYVITVHKSQGSEWPIVILPVHKSFGTLIMQRNLLYTAISRAKQICILIGQREEVPMIIKRNHSEARNTNLKEFLKGEI